MAISKIDRVRIIFDLLKDGKVKDESQYENVDMLPIAIFDKWASRYEGSNRVEQASSIIEDIRDLLKQTSVRHSLNEVRDSTVENASREADDEIGFEEK